MARSEDITRAEAQERTARGEYERALEQHEAGGCVSIEELLDRRSRLAEALYTLGKARG